MTALTATCEVCRNSPAVVVVADDDLTERAVCPECWHKLERLMTVRVVRFAAPYGTRPRRDTRDRDDAATLDEAWGTR